VIREVNIIDHLPLFIQEYREMQGIMDAENPELQLIEDDSETTKNNMFVLYTDEAGIKRYEKMFGLTASKNDSLSNRQARVLAQYTNTVIYTWRGLIERLDIICGVGNYILELIPDEYRINIILQVRVAKLIDTIASMLIDMIPANMICTYAINYNTHELLAKYPTYLLMQFTHQELCEVPIDESFSATCDNITNYTMESFESVSCEHMANYGMRKV
jgi:hypothetical protein